MEIIGVIMSLENYTILLLDKIWIFIYIFSELIEDMKTIVITEYIGLEPEFLSKNMLKPKILESIDEKFFGKCHSKYGFIIKIFKDTVIILENYISSIDNNVNFKVEFNAQIILPEVGQVIKCKVDMIFNHGIFASIHNLKLLVPKTQLSKYEFTTNVDNNPIYK